MANKLLLKGASEIVQVCSNREQYIIEKDMQNLAVLNDSNCRYSIVVDRSGNIADIDTDQAIADKYGSEERFDRVINADGGSVIPGFIDGHTHPVWEGDRVHEFEMKLAGATYMDIHKAGGGIGFTVEHTRKANEEDLYASFVERLNRMLSYGTTMVECKTGYGLNVETEMKMLRVIDKAKKDDFVGPQVISTFCGAHSVPRGMSSTEATDDVINVQLPEIARAIQNKKIDKVENIDVFCEKGVFDIKQTRAILKAGTSYGMNINFHGDELNATNSAELAGELKALAVSHLEKISNEGIQAIAASKTAAVILPTTAYILRLEEPPVRKMINEGVIVSLGTDFNPNAHCLSMPIAMHLACVTMKMTLSEVLISSTINSAYSLGKANTHGSLEVGKRGDFVVLNSSRWQHIVYQFGSAQDLIKTVVVGGEYVLSNIK